VAVHTALFISWSGVQYGPVGQHGPSFLGKIEDVPMAFLALLILKGGIGLKTVLLVVILLHEEMNDNVFDAVGGLRVKEIEGIMGCGKVAVHAVCHEALGIVHMGRGLPRIVCELDLMTRRTKLRCGGPHHGVIGNAKQRKGDENPKGDENDRLDEFLPGKPSASQNVQPHFHASLLRVWGLIALQRRRSKRTRNLYHFSSQYGKFF
jgi:hypothetical protein